MAEIIVAELVKVVFQKLSDEALKQIFRARGIHSELDDLKDTLSQIQDLLNDASDKETTRKDVKQWVNRLQHLAYDIDDVLDGLATDAMHHELTGATTSNKVRKLVPTCCINLSLSSRLQDKLDYINSKLQHLEKEKISLGLIVKDEKSKNTSSRRNETSLLDASFSIVGRHNEKEKLIDKLLRDESCKEKFNVVPIVGMGGVGKTTLARLLYNEKQVNDHFKIMIWICVSDEFDIFKISKNILQSITKENTEFGDLDQVQIALINQFKNKRFLLVLDDVWSENDVDWENLVKPFHLGASGSKIIITTRKEQLLKKLGFDHLDHLESLSNDDAMSLFAQHALNEDNFDSHPTLKTISEGIVKKCGCLPLALRALGRLLRTKTHEEDWEDVLNSEIWDLENVDEIVPALRLSYHDLPACLKQVFAYCSLFPKDFMFNKDDLVLLWMAEGFLNQPSGSISRERLGHDYFEKLLSRSFFQHAPNEESLFVMHDLINDLAKDVAGNLFLRFDNQLDTKLLENYRHMSFLREEYVCYQKFEAFKRAKSLRTFLTVSLGVKQSWDRFYLSNKVLVDLLPALPLLRVICLNGFELSEVPDFIGSLKHLRYLNLSQTRIKELPESVGHLYNLETLIVFGCHNLTKLPNSFLKLKKLKYFDITDTPVLKQMPLGIGELKSLHTLTKLTIGGDDGLAITELKGLKNLQGQISINGLDKVQNTMHARDADLSLKKLTELELEWSDVFDRSRKEKLENEVLNVLKPRTNELTKLKIVSFGGIEFPNWIGDPLFLRLTRVSLLDCKRCTSLPPLGRLPSLKELLIQGMDAMKVVDSELFGTSGVGFPSLELLTFKDMKGWEVWSTTNAGVVFPCLRELNIIYCSNLVDISLQPLTSLRGLELDGCCDGVLTSLVYVASSLIKLEIKSMSGVTDEVWRGVLKHLTKVEELRVNWCNDMQYLWESVSKASKFLVNVRKLVVYSCEKLLRLGEKEDDGSNLLTSLKNLEVWICESMERCCCPNYIETLTIVSCNSITSVSFPTTTKRGYKLKSLEINDCNKLLENEFGGQKINNTSMPKLEYLKIVNWPNLKSSIELSYSIHLTILMIEKCPNMESFPDLQLPNLTHLIIYECQNMKSFPDHQLPNLTSLKHMRIRNCPNMDDSFPRGLWPPKLCTLEIGGLKKPISEWGPQNFPTSLFELELYGGNMSNFSQLSDVLPTSLTYLEIKEFEKLESLSKGLQHLTSLQHLVIRKCPILRHLPKMLFPSLLRLQIGGCPNLKKQADGRGSHYWPVISHIPCIIIKD